MDAAAIQAAVQRFRFERFDKMGEEWEYYIQRFETELALHGLLEGNATANVRRNLLLSKIGSDAFKVVVDHYRPEDVATKTYVALKETLGKHFRKDTCILAERVKFTLRKRKDGETVTQFLSALRAIAGNCGYGNSLNERLRDQLVLGINNDAWQQELFRLHTTNDATIQQVEASALILEQATTQQQRIREMASADQVSEASVRRVRDKPWSSGDAQKHKKGSPWRLTEGVDCFQCGKQRHQKGMSCPAKGITCHACGGMNHMGKVCVKSGNAVIMNKRDKSRRIQAVNTGDREEMAEDTGPSEEDSDINVVQVRAIKGLTARLTVIMEGHKTKMLYDPGAARSVINENIWRKIGSPRLSPTVPLLAYTNVTVQTLGETWVSVKAFERVRKVLVIVIKEHDKPLFGLDWCVAFDVKMPPGVHICTVKKSGDTVDTKSGSRREEEVEPLLSEFAWVFREALSTIAGHKAVVHMKEGAIPKVFSARPIPFPLRSAVEAELNRLVAGDILEPVDTTSTPIEWASPIVCIPKQNGKMRICVDFKATINQYVFVDPHPLPRFEDIAAKLGGSEYFSKIDLSDAYLQMEVDKDSRKFMVIATHMGYYRYKRLPFGVSFAPAIFQKTMDKILAGIPHTAVYIDDIIVAGKTKAEHLQLLREVLQKLNQANIRLKRAKCTFLQSEVTYLGYRIDKHGIHPTQERIEAVRNMPAPTNAKELRSVLGAVNFYSRFIPNLHPMCAPLYTLTKDSVKWHWSKASDDIFQKLKQAVTSEDTLVHYREELPLIMVTDASNQGVGAVLLHRLQDGTEKPVAYASRTFNDREKQYSVIDKEALAIIFGVTKFYQYIFGRKFSLRTDHKPLERILGEKREIPKMAANKLQRWAVTLSAFNYDLQYVQGKDNVVADSLSRLPITTASDRLRDTQSHTCTLLNMRISDLPLTKRELRKETVRSSLLSRVIAYVDRGWPRDRSLVPSELLIFYEKRDSVSYEDGILMWQGRIIVPEKFRTTILETLHDGHPGIWAMRALARFYVWWPNIDRDVEQHVRGCDPC